jgi:predicted aspartyl protease
MSGLHEHATVASVRCPSRRLGRSPHTWLRAATLTLATLVTASPALTAIGSDPRAERGIADSLFATPTTRDHIGRVVVPVRINGRGPFRFIVDTGANHSTISPELVRLLGLKPGDESVVVNGVTGAAQAFFVTVESLQAGDLMIDGTSLPVVWAPVMAGADGILGAAGLNEKSLLIDFQRNRVEIARRIDGFLSAQSVRIHALSLFRGGLIAVDAKMGRTRVTAIVDTGAERTLGNMALRDALKLHRPRGVVTLTSVYGTTAEVESGEIERAPPITIDSLRIDDVEVVYGKFHIFKVWELEDRPALIIGMDVLGTVASLSIDFKNREIYVASLRAGARLSPGQGTLGESAQKR